MGKDAAFPKWLWDVLPAEDPVEPAPPESSPRAVIDVPTKVSLDIPPRAVAPPSASERYDDLVKRMKAEHDVRVVKWRKRNTGCAWQVDYEDGTTTRLIEAPYPRGPVSCAVFLHEIGHHAIGFYRYKPRCYEEYMAWKWALCTMRAEGLRITRGVDKMVDAAMRYAVAKAVRRKLKRLPVELACYLPPGVTLQRETTTTQSVSSGCESGPAVDR